MTKRALVVGISDYPSPNQLTNPIHDALDVRDCLTMHRYGVQDAQSFAAPFKATDCHLLLDARATKANMLSELDWLIRGSRAGDEVVFFYSGHGSQVVDVDGDEVKDHKDEILCPWDFNDWWDKPLSDDVLRLMFKPLAKGAHLTVILDCCHSGSSTRDLQSPKSTSISNYGLERYVRPPLDIHLRAGQPDETAAMRVNRLGVKQLSGYLDVDQTMNHVLLAACRSDQTAADGRGRNGAFTGALLAALVTQPARTWVDLIQDIDENLRKGFYVQTGQLEGCTNEVNRYPFGG